MPIVSRPQPGLSPSATPRPRSRVVPGPNAEADVPKQTEGAELQPTAAPAGPKKAQRDKRQPTGDHLVGYCRTPVQTRFQKDNPGGPGRPKKDSKTQDDLMRAELLKSQHVTEGGRRRRRTMRELVPGLLIKATLQKLSPKELRALQDEARRLFPERAADAASAPEYNSDADLAYVRDMISAIRIGESSGESTDPLADFVTSVFAADDGEDDDGSWDEGDWDTQNEEQSDEAA